MQSYFQTQNIVDELLQNNGEKTLSAQRNVTSRRSIVFVDIRVPDYEKLLVGIEPGTEIVILDSQQDGVTQISNHLQGKQYSALHILSHGSAGSLQIGNGYLGIANLSSYQSQLQQWKDALTEDADILLYGCDVAAEDVGSAFVQQLGQLTGADVAASNDLTGNAGLGGDWDLEVKTGNIESSLAFQQATLESYNSILPSSSVVISQIYGGGGNSGAAYKNDFIELFNRGTTTVNLSGWSVQYAAANGSSWEVANLSGSIAPGSYYLIQLATGTGGTSNLPTPDLTPANSNSINLNASSGKVALVNSQTELQDSNPTSSNIIDFVGYGNTTNNTANASEGSPTPTASNTNAIVRKRGNKDTDNNFNDFITAAANPRNSSSPSPLPQLTSPVSSLSYSENDGFILLDNTITVTDSDSTNFNGGKLVVDFINGTNVNDILLIRNNPTGAFIAGVDIPGLNQIGIGNPVSPTIIGTFTGGMNGIPLEVTFNANATTARVQTLLNNVYYSNISDKPLAGDRTIRFQLTDDTGLTSSPVTKTVNLTAVNDAPIIAAPAASFQLYNGLTTATPNSQGFIYQALPFLPNGSVQNGNQLNTTAIIQDYVGYAAKAELMPILDRSVGYSIKFAVEIVSENHSDASAYKNGDLVADRAGFSVTVIGNDLKGIELAFWENEIWAQNDGAAEPTPGDLTQTLFTHGEGTTISGFTTKTLKNYELKVTGNTYSLFREDYQTAILTGNLRDYTSFATPAYLPSNPYKTPNFLFFGDGTPTSSANFKLGEISVNAGFSSNLSVNEDTDLAVQGISINDVDSDIVTATLKVNNGKLTVNTSVSGGITSATGNGTGEVILSGNINQINTTLAAANGLIYKGNQDFFGNDSLSISATDGTTAGNTKSISIAVASVNDAPSFTIGENQSIKMGSVQRIIEKWANFNPGAANETNQTPMYEIVNVTNPGVFQIAPTINQDGNLIYTPIALLPGTGNRSVTSTIQVKVKDGGIDFNESAIQEFKITVTSASSYSINGNANPNNIKGTDGVDRIDGFDGDDTIYGGSGNDQLFGNNGDDTIYGDFENIPAYSFISNNLFTFNDTIAGGNGDDTIYGNIGDDKLYGDVGDDVIWGGEGSDQIMGGLGKDTFVIAPNQGVDIIQDFRMTQGDVLGCAGGFGLGSLTFQQEGLHTSIFLQSTKLATINNIQSSALESYLGSPGKFVTFP